MDFRTEPELKFHVNGQRDEGQRGEERREGEKQNQKKKLWVQGLMMGPEAMADSVATPVKTMPKHAILC